MTGLDLPHLRLPRLRSGTYTSSLASTSMCMKYGNMLLHNLDGILVPQPVYQLHRLE
jgi:hypothetical protein